MRITFPVLSNVFFSIAILILLTFTQCSPEEYSTSKGQMYDTAVESKMPENSSLPVKPGGIAVSPEKIVEFAKTLIGVPYKYGSVNPAEGFDCSGFITYVFNHFDVKVPRSSIEFTNYGTPKNVDQALPGDLILFTGTDSLERIVGHMGIVVSGPDSLKFIHSTSGKAWGVTITPLNDYYKSRFVKVINIY